MKSTRNVWLAVMGIAALFYLALLPVYLRHLDPVTGDEPFYLMTAMSLLRDQSLDESSNYANRDYEEFYPDLPLPADWQGWPAFPTTLPPHPAITEREGLFTKHGLGLSVLVAVPYELAGRVGAMLVVLAFAVALAGQMFLFARESRVPTAVAAASALAFAFSMPVAPYALLIFPEVPAALLILYATRRVIIGDNTIAQWLLTGAAIGFLPWLHQRFAVVSAVLGMLVLIRYIRTRNPAHFAAIVPVAIGATTIVAYNVWLYGQITQNTQDHAGFSGLSGTVNGAAGLVLDAQWGLFVAAPFMLIAIAAIPAWYRGAGRTVLIAAAVVTPYLIVVAAYQVWWGEWGPPARYLVPVVPLLVAPFAWWLHRATPVQRVVAAAAWLAGLSLTIIGFAQPQRFYHHPDGINNLYTVIGDRFGLDVAGLLVSFQFYAPSSLTERVLAGLFTALLIVVLWLWLGYSGRSQKSQTP